MGGGGSSSARTFNSASTALVAQNPREAPQWLSRTANLADDAASQYEAHYYKLDEWALRAARKGISKIFIGQELIADADFVRTEFYNDWCRKVEGFHCVGSVFSVANGTIGLLGVRRPEGSTPYTVQDKLLTGRLLAHLRRALQIRQRLSKAGLERRATLDALERTGVATLVVGRDGHVLYASGDAERLLREHDVVRLVGGKLGPVTKQSNRDGLKNEFKESTAGYKA